LIERFSKILEIGDLSLIYDYFYEFVFNQGSVCLRKGCDHNPKQFIINMKSKSIYTRSKNPKSYFFMTFSKKIIY
jgi:hypothetical protein